MRNDKNWDEIDGRVGKGEKLLDAVKGRPDFSTRITDNRSGFAMAIAALESEVGNNRDPSEYLSPRALACIDHLQSLDAPNSLIVAIKNLFKRCLGIPRHSVKAHAT